jgi:hypothetical protein
MASRQAKDPSKARSGALTRLVDAWRALASEQRAAALAALALWVTMFLPWYSDTGFFSSAKKTTSSAAYTVSAFGAFSFVEAAVLLVSIAVLGLLFARAEQRAFHLPGGDGAVIAAGGMWVALLIFYRMLDKSGASVIKGVGTTIGIEWGIFLALFAAIALSYQGLRIRTAHVREPQLAEDPTVQWTAIEGPPTAQGIAAAHARDLRAARAARRAARDAEGS